MWGADELFYTLTPATGSNNGYASDCDVVISGITWNITGNSTVNPWRIGGKSLSGVDRAVYSKTAMSSATTKVELKVGAASSITVNSLKLIVASDAGFNTVIDEVTKTFAANTTITFTPTSPATNWASGAYYKFVFNVTVSGSSNKFVEFSEAKFYKEESVAYEITAVSNNEAMGTVSIDGSTITASPKSGYRVKNGDNGYTVTEGTATVAHEGYSNTLTVTPTSDCTVQVNFEAIPTLSSISLTGTYPTVFTEGDDFSHEGMTVTANYSDESTNDVTASATFSGYNMSTPGNQTVTVSYTEDEVTKTTNYGITVNAIPSHTATFSVNGNTTSDDCKEGASIVFPDDPGDINGKTFVGWVTATIDGITDDEPSFVTSAIMGNSNITYYAVFATLIPGTGTVKYDNLTTGTFGNPGSYTSWSGKQATSGSDAIYAGESSGGSSYIQIRATSPSGIVTTTSGGKAKKVTVTWNSSTTSGRTLDIYGKNTAYDSSEDLYSVEAATLGTKLGSVVYGTSTELTITGDYEYIGMRSNSGAMYLDKIVVDWQTGTPDTYSAYCTTVSSLPIPVITLSSDAIEMTWGDEDKILTASATVGGEAYEGDITLTSDDANLTVASDGKLTCNVPGTYHVTASIAATGAHQAAVKTCTVTVGKKDATVSFATATVLVMKSAGSYTQAATKDPDAAGAIAYTISPSGNAINGETGEVTLSTTGNYTVTATAAENTLYNEASGSYTLQVRNNPTIVVANAPVTYGNTFVVDDSVIEGGDITVSSGNEDIATVDGLTITPVAVGTVTITVSTAASDVYVEGEETFKLTVNAPAGGTEKYIPLETLFNETFDKCNGTGGRDDTYTGNVGTSTTSGKLDEVWATIGNNGASKCIKLGTGSAYGTVTTSNISLTGTGTLTFSAAGWESGTNTISVSATGATLSGDTNVTLVNGTWNSYTVNITEATGTVAITFSMKRGFLDDVKVTKAGSPITVTLNGYGYATYCSQYPLDFSKASGYSAWQITSVGTEGAITFEKVKGSVKGGTGLLLKGEDGATITLTSEDSETVLSGNHLVGTLAPLNVNADEYYGLSGNKFVKVSAGNVPAGKALLPVTSIPSSAHQLSFIFEDEGETTGISEVRGLKADVRGEYFNLNGQRVATPVKGNIYIVNGKKVMFK